MSLAIATRGIIFESSTTVGDGDPYPIGVTDVILESEDVGNLFVEVSTEDIPSFPENQDRVVVPDYNKIDSMKRILPKYNVFPGPN